MAGKRPAFQFYASDWLGSTKHAMMTPAQRGAYIDLLCHQWNDADCTLPDDDNALAALSGLNEGWFNGGSGLVRECFPPAVGKPGRLANPRLVEVRADADEWSRKSREGGVKSGASRRASAVSARTSVASASDGDRTTLEPNANQTRTKREPNANQTRTKREPKGNPSPSSPSSSSSSSASPTSPSTPSPEKKKRAPLPDDVESVWSHYKTHRPKVRVLGDEVHKKILARLAKGFTVRDLCDAIDGNFRSPNHCGQNETGTEYHSLELIVRDDAKVQMFIDLAAAQEKPAFSVKTQRTISAGQGFLESRGHTGDDNEQK